MSQLEKAIELLSEASELLDEVHCYETKTYQNIEKFLEEVNTDVVVISKDRYKDLLESEDTLEALQAAGVDNWSGYDYAMEMLEEDE